MEILSIAKRVDILGNTLLVYVNCVKNLKTIGQLNCFHNIHLNNYAL